MRLHVQLADAAQVAGAKLYIMGGCIGHMVVPTPFAIAGWFEIGWDETNRKHKLKIELFSADGKQVLADTSVGTKVPWLIEAEFEVGRPLGIRGGALTSPIALGLPPLNLQPDTYEFRLSIEGTDVMERISLKIGT